MNGYVAADTVKVTRLCRFTVDCAEPAAYVIEWDPDFVAVEGGEACVEHTAQARANDPLEYIASVRSLPRTP
jgi:hypothetical protein